jgi:ArsR family transcriptional regulator
MNSIDLESRSLEAVAARFSALGDPIRLQVLAILSAGEKCVCDLRDEVDIAPNLLSYHLKVLREAGLVEASRRGRWVDYRLAAEGLDAARLAVPAGE